MHKLIGNHDHDRSLMPMVTVCRSNIHRAGSGYCARFPNGMPFGQTVHEHENMKTMRGGSLFGLAHLGSWPDSPMSADHERRHGDKQQCSCCGDDGNGLGRKASRREHARPYLLPDRVEVYCIDVAADGDRVSWLIVGSPVLLVGPSLESVSGTGGAWLGMV